MSEADSTWWRDVRAAASPLALVVAGIFTMGLLGAAAIWLFLPGQPETGSGEGPVIGLRPGLQPGQRLTAQIDETDLQRCVLMYMELTGRRLWPVTNGVVSELDEALGGRLSRWRWIPPTPRPDSGISFHADGLLSAGETKTRVEEALARAHLQAVPVGRRYFQIRGTGLAEAMPR